MTKEILQQAIDALRAAIAQPVQPNLNQAAEHWHALYLQQCHKNKDEAARLGGQIVGLELELANLSQPEQPVCDACGYQQGKAGVSCGVCQPVQTSRAGEPTRCPEKLKPGGCQLHNLHCGWPKCNEAAQPEQPAKMPTDIHSCSLHCDRPACIKAQRDQMRDAIDAAITASKGTT